MSSSLVYDFVVWWSIRQYFCELFGKLGGKLHLQYILINNERRGRCHENTKKTNKDDFG